MDHFRDAESISCDRRTNTYRARHEWTSTGPLSDTILRTVAVATDSDLTTLDPLQDTIDVDSLDRLYKPYPGMVMRKDGGCLTFTFADCAVSVYWDGKITAIPHEDDTCH